VLTPLLPHTGLLTTLESLPKMSPLKLHTVMSFTAGESGGNVVTVVSAAFVVAAADGVAFTIVALGVGIASVVALRARVDVGIILATIVGVIVAGGAGGSGL
jgi:hypothetical protein